MSLSERVDKIFPDGCDRLCFRIDYGDHTGIFDDEFWKKDVILDSIRSYVGAYWQLFSKGACLHLNGKEKRAHVHYVFIVQNKITHSNWSKHRADFLKKSDEQPTFGRKGQVTFKISCVGDAETKASIFTHILKYGTAIPRTFTIDGYRPMPENIFNALVELGRNLPERPPFSDQNEKVSCKKRKRCELSDLYELCKNGSDSNKFKNFHEMRVWLDDVYIKELEIDEMPNADLFKLMCAKVATKLGIYKYSEF